MLVILAVLLIGVLVRGLLLELFYVPSASMEPTYAPGDRVAVWRPGAQEVSRGDVVVFDGTGSFTPYDPSSGWVRETGQVIGAWLGLSTRDDVYIKRVIGVSGDEVECCAEDGRLLVNGEPLTEDYLPEGEAPSEQKFSVRVPEGRLWVMGDHRSDSVDSRNLLGAPGGGMIPVHRVIGHPVGVLWPPERISRTPG